MSDTIDVAFVQQFEKDVHLAYQRMGSKLRNTLRTKNNVKNKTTFQKVGKGTMGTKTRHGKIPLMNLTHTNVSVTLTEYFAGEYVDNFDELRIEHDERMVVAQSAAAAAGRKTDEIITTALDATTNVYNSGTAVDLSAASGVGLGHCNALRELLDNADVPDDGLRYAPVPSKGWSQLIALDEFSNADYVGQDQLVYKAGMSAKRWNSFYWFGFTGLPASGSDKKAFVYHKTAAGHAIGSEMHIKWSWENTRDAHFMNCGLQQEAVVIDADGVVEYVIDHS